MTTIVNKDFMFKAKAKDLPPTLKANAKANAKD